MDLDAGVSYNAAPTAIQRLLAKVKARKKAAGEGETNQLSAKLDHLIQFADIKYPKAVLQSSWRQIKKPSTKSLLTGGPGKLGDSLQHQIMKSRLKSTVGKHVEDIAKGLERFRFISGKLDELIQFGSDPRPRNPLGEFSGQQEEGPNPNSMVKTYRIAPAQTGVAPHKNGPGVLGASGLTVLGGAGGALGAQGAKSALAKIGEAISKSRKR